VLKRATGDLCQTLVKELLVAFIKKESLSGDFMYLFSKESLNPKGGSGHAILETENSGMHL
jgi:hypothetical protein